jgi:hypothetical protein
MSVTSLTSSYPIFLAAWFRLVQCLEMCNVLFSSSLLFFPLLHPSSFQVTFFLYLVNKQ